MGSSGINEYMGARSSETYLRRRTMLRIFLLALLCAAVTATPLGSDFEEVLPQEGEFQLPEAFIEESGPWVPPASGWEGANACARRFEDVAVNSWKKVKGKSVKRLKQCEVKVKGAKWNKIKGFAVARCAFVRCTRSLPRCTMLPPFCMLPSPIAVKQKSSTRSCGRLLARLNARLATPSVASGRRA